MSEVKYIDLSYLKEFSNNDNEFIVEMIEAYLKQTPQIVSVIKNSYESNDWNSLKQAAHKLKPSMTFLGIKELEQIVPEIESLAAEMNDSAQLRKHIDKLLYIIDFTYSELNILKQNYS